MKKTTLLSLFLAASLTACSTVGTQALKGANQSSVEQKLQVGHSKKEDVKQEYGEPATSISTSDGSEIWIYKYTHSTPWVRDFIPIYGLFDGGADLTHVELIVVFDLAGVVSKVQVKNTSDTMKRGITVQ